MIRDRLGAAAGALLRVPLFHKLLVANVVVVGAAVSATAWLLLRHAPGGPAPATPAAWLLLGILLFLGSVVANGAVLRVALSPLRSLEETARTISAGRSVPRASPSPLADRQLARLITTFNDMLDQVEQYQGRLRALASRSLAAQEEERERVALELHDDAGQRLSVLLLRLEVLRARAAGSGLETEVEGLRQELVASAEALRTFARGLRPPALTELGLVPALDAHLREVEKDAPFAVEFDRPHRALDLSPDAELAAYRIVQEAVSNARRHAEASRIRVSVTVLDDAVELRVEDDGRGFRPLEIRRRRDGGLGLFGMEERAGYVGGRLRVESLPGRGSQVSVFIPRMGASPCRPPPTPTGSGAVDRAPDRRIRAPAAALP